MLLISPAGWNLYKLYKSVDCIQSPGDITAFVNIDAFIVTYAVLLKT